MAITVRPQLNPVGSVASRTFPILCFGDSASAPGPHIYTAITFNTYTNFTFNWTRTITTYTLHAFHMATVPIDLLHFNFRLSCALRKRRDRRNVWVFQTHSQVTHTLRQNAIHSNFIVVARARSFESDFLECRCRRCRDPSSNAFMLFLCKQQTVLTGRRSIVVKRIENIKIASPHIGAQKQNNLIMNDVAKPNEITFYFCLSVLLLPAALWINVLIAGIDHFVWQKSK